MVCGAEEGIGLHPHCLTLRLGQDGNQCDVGQPMCRAGSCRTRQCHAHPPTRAYREPQPQTPEFGNSPLQASSSIPGAQVPMVVAHQVSPRMEQC